MLFTISAFLFALTINSVNPTTINSSDDIVTISATASGLSNTQYLQAVFTKEGESSSNYFGYTKNLLDEWYQYKSSPPDSDLAGFFYSFLPVSGTWSGQLSAKVDISDDGYKGPGNYILKLFKPTSGSVSKNSVQIAINIPLAVPVAPEVIPDPVISWEMGTGLEIGHSFKCSLHLKNLEKDTQYYLKVRGGTDENKLVKIQTKNNSVFLSDNENWSGFPLVKVDGSGNWDGEVWGIISEEKDPGKYKLRIRARKKETESFYESDIKEINFAKIADIPVATKTAEIVLKKSSPSAVLGSSISAEPKSFVSTMPNPKEPVKKDARVIIFLITGIVLLLISGVVFVKKWLGGIIKQ